MRVKRSRFVRDGSQGRIGSSMVAVSMLKAVASVRGVSRVDVGDEDQENREYRKGK